MLSIHLVTANNTLAGIVIMLDCIFSHQKASWWVSRQGYKMINWGGATSGSKKCACGMTYSCVDPQWSCNCDAGNDQWGEDSSFLVDKKYLPVSELRFGETGNSFEKGYHTLGKLLCWH